LLGQIIVMTNFVHYVTRSLALINFFDAEIFCMELYLSMKWLFASRLLLNIKPKIVGIIFGQELKLYSRNLIFLGKILDT
jgi:hypothetical protein